MLIPVPTHRIPGGGHVVDVRPGTEVCTPVPQLQSGAQPNAYFPIVPADVATLLLDVAAEPSYIFDCQETGSGPLIDAVVNEQFVPYPLFGDQPTKGVSIATAVNGGARTAVQFSDGGTQCFNATSIDVLSLADGAVGILGFAELDTDTNTDGLFTLGAALTSGEDAYVGGIHGTVSGSGLYGASISDGNAAAAASLIGTSISDGVLHLLGWVYDPAAETVTTFHEFGQHVRDVSALDYSAQMAAYFSTGDGYHYLTGGGSNRYGAAPAKITWMGLFRGAAAQAITLAGIQNFHGQAIV